MPVFINVSYHVCIHERMQLTGDDYSDLVTYLTGLFSIKKIPEILVDRFLMKYNSCYILDGPDSDKGELIQRFPEDDERDRIKYVVFDVKHLHPTEDSVVRINWESIEITPDIDQKVAKDFVDVLDRSTFRYF